MQVRLCVLQCWGSEGSECYLGTQLGIAETHRMGVSMFFVFLLCSKCPFINSLVICEFKEKRVPSKILSISVDIFYLPKKTE